MMQPVMAAAAAAAVMAGAAAVAAAVAAAAVLLQQLCCAVPRGCSYAHASGRGTTAAGALLPPALCVPSQLR